MLWKSGEMTLLVPETEREYVETTPDTLVRSFEYETISEIRDLNQSLRPELERVFDGKAVSSVGMELCVEQLAPSRWPGEVRVVSQPFINLVRSLVPGAPIVDVTPELWAARAVKDAGEIERLRTANRAARLGFEELLSTWKEGWTERKIAGALEAAIHAGAARCGARYARAFAAVMSGPQSAKANAHFCISSDRSVRRGDVVLIELGTMVDGYMSDLTRVFVMGEARGEAKDVFALLALAQQEAFRVLKDGALTADVDRAARETIREAGYGKYFTHILGHGVGLSYHEAPVLHPLGTGMLRAGMVHSVEPGIYIPGQFGMRIEDNVVVTASGCEVLSDFLKTLEWRAD